MKTFLSFFFLFSRVHATLQPAMSVGRSVGPSVRPSVRISFFGVTGGFCVTAPAQMLGLTFFITAPAHPHTTSVAVYPALYFLLFHYCPLVRDLGEVYTTLFTC